MNNIVSRSIFIGIMLLTCGRLVAQERIVISDFHVETTDLTARMRPESDYTNEKCACLLFNVKDTTFIIEGNLGVLKRETKVGGIRLWVPAGTKRLTVRHEGVFPLRGYVIPLNIAPQMSYHAYLSIETVPPPSTYETHFYMGAGFNLLSIQGPSVAIGVDINHHVIEVGGISGLQKSDNLYFYSGDNLKAAYQYQALRGFLKYGYDIKPADMVGIMPFVGAALNVISGKTVEGQNINSESYKKASSISVIGGVRLSVLLGKHIRLHATPEYDFGAYKSKNCKLLNDNDENIKKWTDGIGVNVGLLLYF